MPKLPKWKAKMRATTRNREVLEGTFGAFFPFQKAKVMFSSVALTLQVT